MSETHHRLARVTERRDYLDEGATTDRKLAFDPRRVTIVCDDNDDGEGNPGAWVHLSIASEWEAPADWKPNRTDSVFLTREPYADVLREIDLAIRGVTPVSAATMDTPIGDLEWSVRTRNVFAKIGLRTVGGLCALSAAQLFDHSNFGRTCLREVRERLARLGLALRGDETL